MRFLEHLFGKCISLFQTGQSDRIYRNRLNSTLVLFENYCFSVDLSVSERSFLEHEFRACLRNTDIEPHKAFVEALSALEKYQVEMAKTKAKELANRPSLEIAFFDESEWKRSWIDERRLTVLTTAQIKKDYDGKVCIERPWMPMFSAQFGIVSGASEFCLDKLHIAANHCIPSISRRPQWARNIIAFNESNEAVDLGMQCYTTETQISISVSLNSVVFDFLVEKLDCLRSDASDTLLLACGLPVPTGKIPRSRPIKWPQKIPDPVRLTAEPPRMSFEIAKLRETDSHTDGQQVVTLARWMAVEENTFLGEMSRKS